MKLSESKIINKLNFLATVALVFYVIAFFVNLFSSGPGLSHSIKEDQIYDVIAIPKNQELSRSLYTWFNSKIFVSPTNRASIHLRYRSYSELFSVSSVLFQLSKLVYWLFIGYIILCFKKLFRSFSKDKVFTRENASAIISGAIALISLPAIRYVTQELLINCIFKLGLNDSAYELRNGAHVIGSETLIGFAFLAFGFAFKVGADIKKENEQFI